MTIASEITRIEGNISAAYTAANAKGATMPVTENSDNLATCIASIPSGGGVGIPREVVNGVYQQPSTSFTFTLPSGTTDIGYYGLASAFNNSSGLIGADLSSLITVSGYYALYMAFNSCTNMTSVDLSGLTSITAEYCFRNTFAYTNFTSIEFTNLTSITGNYAFWDCFLGNTYLTSISFPKLSIMTGSSCLNSSCRNCTGIMSISFPSLTTTSFGSNSNQMQTMLSNTGTQKTHTIHFPSNLETTIQSLQGYPTFGGISGYVTLAFDLPATS